MIRWRRTIHTTLRSSFATLSCTFSSLFWLIPSSRPHFLSYHPNIDLNGRVCLNILRHDWKPVLTLGHVLFGIAFLTVFSPFLTSLLGIMTLFLEPNPDDPLNHEAADLMVKNRSQFEANVKKSLQGTFSFFGVDRVKSYDESFIYYRKCRRLMVRWLYCWTSISETPLIRLSVKALTLVAWPLPLTFYPTTSLVF